MGPAVPVPPPKSVMEALSDVQVTNGLTRSGFQLAFTTAKNSALLQSLLPAGYFDPGIRVMVIVTVSGMPSVIMDGIITRQEVAPSSEAGQSRITVTGEDLSVLMDVVSLQDLRYPGMPPPAIVALLLARYAVFGIVPIVIPPIFMEVPLPTDRIPSQNGTDLDYIRLLAGQVGHIFFVEAGPAPGGNIAYWGPDFRIPNPQPALNVNMDAQTNVESLNFSLDGLAKKITVMYVYDPFTQSVPIPIPVPNISILRPPLTARPTLPMRVEFSSDVSKRSPLAAVALALARTSESSDSVTGSGQLNVLRYGRVLKARQLVGVRGAGLAYDGLYYVRSVTHSLKRGEYKQSFQLSRDGLISLTPRVLP